MALKIVVIVAVAVVVRLASTEVTSLGVKYDFGDFTDFIEGLKNGTYPFSPSVTKFCFRTNREKFKCMSRDLALLTRKAGDRFEKFFQNRNITDAMKRFSESFRELPTTVWTPLEELNYTTALMGMEDAGKVEDATYVLVMSYATGNKTAIEKVYKQFTKIATAKFAKSRKLTATLKDCMAKGNPRLPAREDV